jgi:hypothetical protein
LPSYEVNIEVVNPSWVFSHEGFIHKENNLSRIDNLMFASYEGNNCSIIPKLLCMFKTCQHMWISHSDACTKRFDSTILSYSLIILHMFCFVEDNKIISSLRFNYGTGMKRKKGFSTHFQLSRVVDLATAYCLPLYYTCLGCLLDCLSRHQIFCKTPKFSCYFYNADIYERYNIIIF